MTSHVPYVSTECEEHNMFATYLPPEVILNGDPIFRYANEHDEDGKETRINVPRYLHLDLIEAQRVAGRLGLPLWALNPCMTWVTRLTNGTGPGMELATRDLPGLRDLRRSTRWSRLGAGLIFRSGSPSFTDAKRFAEIFRTTLGIKSVIDFRNPEEAFPRPFDALRKGPEAAQSNHMELLFGDCRLHMRICEQKRYHEARFDYREERRIRPTMKLKLKNEEGQKLKTLKSSQVVAKRQTLKSLYERRDTIRMTARGFTASSQSISDTATTFPTKDKVSEAKSSYIADWKVGKLERGDHKEGSDIPADLVFRRWEFVPFLNIEELDDLNIKPSKQISRLSELFVWVLENKKEEIRYIFELISEVDPPLLLISEFGKDRVGLISMLLLLCLGATVDEIVADWIASAPLYAAAAQYVASENREKGTRMRQSKIQIDNQQTGISAGRVQVEGEWPPEERRTRKSFIPHYQGSAIGRAVTLDLCGVRVETARTVCATIDALHGGIFTYLVKLCRLKSSSFFAIRNKFRDKPVQDNFQSPEVREWLMRNSELCSNLAKEKIRKQVIDETIGRRRSNWVANSPSPGNLVSLRIAVNMDSEAADIRLGPTAAVHKGTGMETEFFPSSDFFQEEGGELVSLMEEGRHISGEEPELEPVRQSSLRQCPSSQASLGGNRAVTFEDSSARNSHIGLGEVELRRRFHTSPRTAGGQIKGDHVHIICERSRVRRIPLCITGTRTPQNDEVPRMCLMNKGVARGELPTHHRQAVNRMFRFVKRMCEFPNWVFRQNGFIPNRATLQVVVARLMMEQGTTRDPYPAPLDSSHPELFKHIAIKFVSGMHENKSAEIQTVTRLREGWAEKMSLEIAEQMRIRATSNICYEEICKMPLERSHFDPMALEFADRAARRLPRVSSTVFGIYECLSLNLVPEPVLESFLETTQQWEAVQLYCFGMVEHYKGKNTKLQARQILDEPSIRGTCRYIPVQEVAPGFDIPSLGTHVISRAQIPTGILELIFAGSDDIHTGGNLAEVPIPRVHRDILKLRTIAREQVIPPGFIDEMMLLATWELVDLKSAEVDDNPFLRYSRNIGNKAATDAILFSGKEMGGRDNRTKMIRHLLQSICKDQHKQLSPDRIIMMWWHAWVMQDRGPEAIVEVRELQTILEAVQDDWNSDNEAEKALRKFSDENEILDMQNINGETGSKIRGAVHELERLVNNYTGDLIGQKFLHACRAILEIKLRHLERFLPMFSINDITKDQPCLNALRYVLEVSVRGPIKELGGLNSSGDFSELVSNQANRPALARMLLDHNDGLDMLILLLDRFRASKDIALSPLEAVIDETGVFGSLEYSSESARWHRGAIPESLQEQAGIDPLVYNSFLNGEELAETTSRRESLILPNLRELSGVARELITPEAYYTRFVSLASTDLAFNTRSTRWNCDNIPDVLLSSFGKCEPGVRGSTFSNFLDDSRCKTQYNSPQMNDFRVKEEAYRFIDKQVAGNHHQTIAEEMFSFNSY